jgi:transcriptional regulator with XRE-family HTH domain
MERQFLGEEIKRIRVKHRLTQKQLSLGICKQGVLSKIENGEFFPSFEVLIALSNRLKLPIHYFFESAISGQFYQVNVVKNEVDSLIIKHNYIEAFIMADRELQTNDFLLGEHKQYFVWARAVSAFKIELLTFGECVDILERCLSEKIDYINQGQRMLIHNSLATINAEVGNNEKALVDYEKFLLEFKSESNTLFYVRVLFNYANALHNHTQFEKALETVNEAMNLCRKVENIRMLGMFYYLKGECLNDLGSSKEEISTHFKKALTYFEILNHEDYIKILMDNYSDYL